MNFKKLSAALVGIVMAVSFNANAGLIFTFLENGGDVTMTSSGSIDTSGLVLGATSGWSSTGIEENTNFDILGGTSFGLINNSFGFNAGTDFSQWASATGPWTSSFFPFSVVSGSKSFATYIRNGIQNPGLGIVSSDLNGSIWTTDQNWLATAQSFNSLGMITGTYTVIDAVSSEFITIQIGQTTSVPVPEPSTLAIFGLALMGLASRRFKKQ